MKLFLCVTLLAAVTAAASAKDAETALRGRMSGGIADGAGGPVTAGPTCDNEDKALSKAALSGHPMKNLKTAGDNTGFGGYSVKQAAKAEGYADKAKTAAPSIDAAVVFNKLFDGATSDTSACNAAHWTKMAPNMYGDDDTFPKCKTKDNLELVKKEDLKKGCQEDKCAKAKCAKEKKKPCSDEEVAKTAICNQAELAGVTACTGAELGTEYDTMCKLFSGRAILDWSKGNEAGLKKMADYALAVYTTNNYVSMNGCLRTADKGYSWKTDGNSESWGTKTPWQFVGNIYDQDKKNPGPSAFTCKHMAVMTACAVKGLAALPSQTGAVYRVDDFSASWAADIVKGIEEKKERSDLAFASTSSSDKYFNGESAGFLKQCATHRSKYTLKANSNCKKIRKYSAYPEEEEVLCLPNTKFTLTKTSVEKFTKGNAPLNCKGKDVTTWLFTEK